MSKIQEIHAELHAVLQQAILDSLGINKDSEGDPVLRQITLVASQTLKVPGVIINFVLPDEQITVTGTMFGTKGFMENYRMARKDSVCRIMMDENIDTLEVTDLRQNEKTKLLPIVASSLKSLFFHAKSKYNKEVQGPLTTELEENQEDTLKFYYGTRLKVDNAVVGTVCALDTKPRPDWNKQQTKILKQFGKIVTNYLLERKKWQESIQQSLSLS